MLGGFSVIDAKDLDEAVRIAESCPLLELGGVVEVRPVRRLQASAVRGFF